MAAGMAGELGPMPLSVRQRARRSRSLARRWRWRLAHSFERLRVPFLRDGIDSVSSRCICALVTMSRVRKCIRSTRSKRAHRARVPKRRAAVRCHALNDLSRVVTLPGVQQARSEEARHLTWDPVLVKGQGDFSRENSLELECRKAFCG